MISQELNRHMNRQTKSNLVLSDLLNNHICIQYARFHLDPLKMLRGIHCEMLEDVDTGQGR